MHALAKKLLFLVAFLIVTATLVWCANVSIVQAGLPSDSVFAYDVVTTTSSTYVDLENMTLSLNLTEETSVFFFCDVACMSNVAPYPVYFQMIYDSTFITSGLGGYAQDADEMTKAILVATKSIPAGNYTVKVQWHSIGSAVAKARHRHLLYIVLQDEDVGGPDFGFVLGGFALTVGIIATALLLTKRKREGEG